ncbi:MAG: hypothetical protein ACI9NT_002364 [Bacteroidia bacterium]|jgi:hypothetical protein
MTTGIDDLHNEQRRFVGRVMRILAVGALLGGVFFLYTELIMTMEHTRQWLLNDTPRDTKIARALSDSTLIQNCDAQQSALSDELLSARQAQQKLTSQCDQETNALRSALTAAQSVESSSVPESTITDANRIKLHQQAETIDTLRGELERSRSKGLAFEEAMTFSSKNGSSKKRAKPISKEFSLELGTAFYEEQIGLSVSLINVATHYDAQVRVQLPGQAVSLRNMSPGTQTTFVHVGAHYSLVLLQTEPESGEADFSLVGRTIEAQD